MSSAGRSLDTTMSVPTPNASIGAPSRDEPRDVALVEAARREDRHVATDPRRPGARARAPSEGREVARVETDSAQLLAALPKLVRDDDRVAHALDRRRRCRRAGRIVGMVLRERAERARARRVNAWTNECAIVPTTGIPYRRPASRFDVDATPASVRGARRLDPGLEPLRAPEPEVDERTSLRRRSPSVRPSSRRVSTAGRG